MSKKTREKKVLPIGNNFEILGKRIDPEYSNYLTRKEIEKFKTLDQKNLEKRQNYQQLCRFNPWGKPGGGAPNKMRKRQKFLEIQGVANEMEFTDDLQPSLSFGRPGHGAPLVTKSGRLRSQISGDPVIRFQDSQNVHKSVENGIRYFNGRKAQDEYKNDLDKLVEHKVKTKKSETELQLQLEEKHERNYPFGQNIADVTFNTSPRNYEALALPEVCYDPWGKGFGTPRRDDRGNVWPRLSPVSAVQEIIDWEKFGNSILLGKYSGGDGAPHISDQKDSLKTVVAKLPRTLDVDGVKENMANGIETDDTLEKSSSRRKDRSSLLEKLGWSEDSSKMSEGDKRSYLQDLKSAIEVKSKTQRNEQAKDKEGGVEFAELMKDKKVGYPRRKEMQTHGLSSTDVTKMASLSYPTLYWSNTEYRDVLDKQKESRQMALQKMKETEVVDSVKHFETWDSMWGRPGHGAPKNSNYHRKEGVGPLYKVHSKIPLMIPANLYTNSTYQQRHQLIGMRRGKF